MGSSNPGFRWKTPEDNERVPHVIDPLRSRNSALHRPAARHRCLLTELTEKGRAYASNRELMVDHDLNDRIYMIRRMNRIFQTCESCQSGESCRKKAPYSLDA